MKDRGETLFDRSYVQLAHDFNVGMAQTRAAVPLPLYNSYINLARHEQALHDKLELVINDGEHILAMEEGASSFNLPPPDHLALENAVLGKTLKSAKPYKSCPVSDGIAYPKLSHVSGLFDLFACGHAVVAGLNRVFNETDYLKYHRHLRNELGIHYAGPKSLNEWLASRNAMRQVVDMHVTHVIGRSPFSRRPDGGTDSLLMAI